MNKMIDIMNNKMIDIMIDIMNNKMIDTMNE